MLPAKFAHACMHIIPYMCIAVHVLVSIIQRCNNTSKQNGVSVSFRKFHVSDSTHYIMEKVTPVTE